MRFVALVGVVAVACLHAGVWALSRDVVGAPSVRGQLASVSYTPFDGCTYDPNPKPDSPKRCSPERIRADLAAIAPYTRTIRTYSSTGGTELIPEIAREFGLRVSIGAWLDKDADRNEREIAAVIDLARKDAFNAIEPTSDGVALDRVTDPEVPKLLKAVFNVDSPAAPRNDLVTIFLTGIAGLNQPAGVRASEMLRLNMAIPPSASPNRMGVLGGDLAGFPNGRRVGDDVLDIVLQAAAGATPLTPAFNRSPNNGLGDGVGNNDVPYLPRFPYLGVPHAGNR